ncbi:hypothetical protein [Pseudoxanthomonas winnipegensis]|uniref:hypothetical protein n=1 Tax=Pseudoxanthomonas winnipegensis TaxID=2480810 RepID=UPI0030F42629
MSAINLIDKLLNPSFALIGQLLSVSRKTIARRLSFLALTAFFLLVGLFLILKFVWDEIDSRSSWRNAEQIWATEYALRSRALSAIDDCIEATKREDPEVKWYCDEAKWRYTQVAWPTPQERENEVVKREVYWAMRSDLLMQSRREEAKRKASRPELWERVVGSLGKFELQFVVAFMITIAYLSVTGALYRLTAKET